LFTIAVIVKADVQSQHRLSDTVLIPCVDQIAQLTPENTNGTAKTLRMTIAIHRVDPKSTLSLSVTQIN